LLESSNPLIKAEAVALGDVTADLSNGVHLLVLSGCSADTLLRAKSTAECGEDYDAKRGNLRLRVMDLPMHARTAGTLGVDVIHLSEAIERQRSDRHLTVAYGPLSTPDASAAEDASVDDASVDDASVAEGSTVAIDPTLFVAPDGAANVAVLDLDVRAASASVYRSRGFRVSFVDDDAGTAEPVLAEALESIQYLSAPTSIPTTYFGAPSNYYLLLLGDPAPRLSDGGVDTDPRRRPHLLAVPVADPIAAPTAEPGGASSGAGF
jgi:hypothetical protein